MIAAASAWLVLAATSPAPGPSPTPSPQVTENQFNGSGDSYSAGLYGFLVIAALVVAMVVIVFFMNRSLRRARANLGGDVLPRREADRVPTAAAPPRTRAPERPSPDLPPDAGPS